MLRLECKAHNYAWGMKGGESEVAQLHKFNSGKMEEDLDLAAPFAEFWMGTHKNGPSKVIETGETLQEWLEKHPQALGDTVRAKFGVHLPYLFKVLSVNTALSIQSHPDKKLAEKLHAERPDIYKDDNHKPEMALAIQNFSALCGFVTMEELKQALKDTPELVNCVGKENSDGIINTNGSGDEKTLLKNAFSSLMTCDSELVKKNVQALGDRLMEKSTEEISTKEECVIQLQQDYPGDVGVLAAYFLNLVELEPGQAMYLPANEPHAYVSGEIVECMATSDNVIRAGLTPKLRDTPVLVDSLTYTMKYPDILQGEPLDDYTKAYRPPFEEFEVHQILLPKGKEHDFIAQQGPAILLVHVGQVNLIAKGGPMDGAQNLVNELQGSRGDVVFIPASTSVQMIANTEQEDEVVTIWLATCNKCLGESNQQDSSLLLENIPSNLPNPNKAAVQIV
eukprot:TRINITY_DN15082_c0_g2_i4.p1 TRINITY_DN15082_c0_g2~~TRINITY_DN15082_c0_g2_i4.p1  ORF type:complete len:451 (-),score=76.17 TRINITY_DN15082_c0_g2_i4:379-1731(-)